MLPQGMWVFLDWAAVAIVPTTVAALFASAGLVLGGWWRQRDIVQRQTPAPAGEHADVAQPPSHGMPDLGAEASAVLRSCETLAAQRLVTLEVAVQPRLSVQADPRAVRQIIADLVAHAIEQAPCGHVLLGAARVGNRVQISVSDDGAGCDCVLQAGQLRAAERLAALQGAALEISPIAGQGTTVIVRLPAAAAHPLTAAGADPASIWAPAAGGRTRAA